VRECEGGKVRRSLEGGACSGFVVSNYERNFPELAAAGGAWECRPELSAVENALREALTAEDAERTERGRKGRELVESKYSWDTVAGHLLAACT